MPLLRGARRAGTPPRQRRAGSSFPSIEFALQYLFPTPSCPSMLFLASLPRHLPFPLVHLHAALSFIWTSFVRTFYTSHHLIESILSLPLSSSLALAIHFFTFPVPLRAFLSSLISVLLYCVLPSPLSPRRVGLHPICLLTCVTLQCIAYTH